MTDYNRGDLVWANLEPVRRGEQGRTRPCVVVSYDAMNHSKHPCIVICPVTGKENVHKEYPTHVILLAKYVSIFDKDSVVMAEQVRAIAKERIDINRKAISLSADIMEKVDRALRKVLDL